MQTSQRGSAPVRPGDVTGKLFAQQQREKRAKDAAQDVDVEAVHKIAWSEGFSAGYDAGVAAVIRQLDDQGQGLIDVETADETDEPGAA